MRNQEPDFTNELILAGCGLAFAVVAFSVLGLVQRARLRREKTAQVQSMRSSVAKEDALAGATPYFVARFNGNKPRLFRVYVDQGALLFLHVGPYFMGVDADIARGGDRHWLLRAGGLIVAGLGIGAAMAAVGLGVLGRAIARNAGKNPEGAYDITMWIFGIIAFVAVMFIVIVPGVVWRITRRGRELDALPLSGLREQTIINDWSFLAAPENTTDVRIDSLDLDTPYKRFGLCATLSLRHDPTGKWKIETTATKDTRDAVAAFRQVFGDDAVAIDAKLKSKVLEA